MLFLAATVTAISYSFKYLFCITENLSWPVLYAWLAAIKLNTEC